MEKQATISALTTEMIQKFHQLAKANKTNDQLADTLNLVWELRKIIEKTFNEGVRHGKQEIVNQN